MEKSVVTAIEGKSGSLAEGLAELFSDRKIAMAVLVSALGYFVDVFDLILFSLVRVSSLKSLGLEGEALLDYGAYILNAQLIGLLIGGFLWGILGDKFGRVRILFGSILLYSLATMANAYVVNVEQYALCRLIAGLGLAGELGASVTLVAELMSRQYRGLGITLLATSGMAGAIVASLSADLFSWTTAYIVGGLLGLSLLVLRIAVSESSIFAAVQGRMDVKRGSLKLLFRSRESSLRYLYCFLIGTPVWLMVGIVVTFAPEIGKAIGFAEEIKVHNAVFWMYVGSVLGDLLVGYLSQILQSRRKPIALGIVGVALGLGLLFYAGAGQIALFYYLMCAIIGLFQGYSAVFSMIVAEQFGANLRATAAISIPNMVRGSAIPMVFAFKFLKDAMGVLAAVEIVSAAVIALALFAVWRLRETYGVPMDYVEMKNGHESLYQAETI